MAQQATPSKPLSVPGSFSLPYYNLTKSGFVYYMNAYNRIVNLQVILYEIKYWHQENGVIV